MPSPRYSRRSLLALAPFAAAGALLPDEGQAAATTAVSITGFGASPAAPSATNTGAIYAALAAAGPGGEVMVPAGRYACGSVVIDGAAGLRLVGPGVLVGDAGLPQLVAVVNSSDVTLDGLGLVAASGVALYAYRAERLTLRGVTAVGGVFAGLFLDRCPAPRLEAVTVRGVHGTYGVGVWVIRGGSGLRVDGLTVEDVDGNALSIDAGTTNDRDAAACVGASISNLVARSYGQVQPNCAALHLAGAREVTVTGLRAEAGAHGIVCEQDQSALVADTVSVAGAVFAGLTGYAVALVGGRNVTVAAARWDGRGTGALLTQPGAGGAAPIGNRIAIDAPAPERR